MIQISVIIPTYNRADLLKLTLDSLLDQVFTNFEVLVIDDGSTDHTESMILDFFEVDQRILYYKRPSNLPKGGNSCRNYGLSIARGTYIKWIDSDDLLHKDALKIQLLDIKDSNTQVSICNSLIFENMIENSQLKRWGNVSGDQSLSSFVSGAFRWHTCAALWEKKYFTEFEVWKQGLTNSQEWLMHATQLIKGCSISIVEDSLCYIRYHTQNMSSSSNKKALYYFNEVKARLILLELMHFHNQRLNFRAKKKFFKQVLIYNLFILYKKDVFNFMLSTFNIIMASFKLTKLSLR